MRAAKSPVLQFAMVLVLPALPLVASTPAHPLIFGELSNAAHAPVFGTLAFVFLRLSQRYMRWPTWLDYFVALILAIIGGAIVELVQSAIGRDAELADVATDACGAIGGLALAAYFQASHRRLAALLFVGASMAALWPVATALLAYQERYSQAPAVLEINSRLDWYFIRTRDARASTALLPETWRGDGDPASIRLHFVPGRWPVLELVEPIPDWRAYTMLMIDLTNPAPRDLRMTLRVHDRKHDNQHADRFNRGLTIAAGTRIVVRTPLSEIADAPADRTMDLSSIAGLILYAEASQRFAAGEFYVTRIWLK